MPRWSSSPAASVGSGRALFSALQSGRWADLLPRVASAAVLAPLALLCVWYGGLSWAVLLGVCAVAMSLEWARMFDLTDHVSRAVMIGGVLAAQGAALLQAPLTGGVILVLMAAVLWRLTREVLASFGVIYIGLPVMALAVLRLDDTTGLGNVIFLVALVWVSDIAAYVAGRVWGGPKLAPRISPGKTWSGAIGGLAGVMILALGVALARQDSAFMAMLTALMLGVCAQFGDLFESWIKRRQGVKDSGALIPGHGGVLDRLDAFLAAAPLAAWLAYEAGRGEYLWR